MADAQVAGHCWVVTLGKSEIVYSSHGDVVVSMVTRWDDGSLSIWKLTGRAALGLRTIARARRVLGL